MTEMVRADLQLESVFGPPGGWHHQPGVVDQKVQPGVPGPDLRGGLAYRGQRGQVEAL